MAGIVTVGWILFLLFDSSGDTATLILLRLGVDLSSYFLEITIFLLIFLVPGVSVLITEVNLMAKELVFLNTSEVVPNLCSSLTSLTE